MSILAQYLILGQQQTLDSAHQRTTLTSQIGSSLTDESRLEQVAGTDTDTQRQRTIHRLASSVLIDSERRVQATTLKEHGTQRRTRPLRSDHDHVNIRRRNNARTIVPSDCETMREIQGLASCQIRLHRRPYRHYGSVGQQAHDDRGLVASLLDTEQSLTRNPSVLNRFIVSLTLALANDYVETIVTKVQ